MPINLRPLLVIRKGHNPKGIGLCLWGYAKLHARNPDQRYAERIAYLLSILGSLRSEGFSGNCWGYNFDWQSRVFYLPRWTPTIVNTSFIGHALLDTYRSTGNQQALELALPIAEFMLNDLNRTTEKDAFCFSYTPLDRLAIHNANVMGASLLIRLFKLTGDSKLREAALTSLAYSMRHCQIRMAGAGIVFTILALGISLNVTSYTTFQIVVYLVASSIMLMRGSDTRVQPQRRIHRWAAGAYQ